MVKRNYRKPLTYVGVALALSALVGCFLGEITPQADVVSNPYCGSGRVVECKLRDFDLAAHIQVTCTDGSCHDDVASRGGLDLSNPDGDLVGLVDTFNRLKGDTPQNLTCESLFLVDPGDTDCSLMVEKLLPTRSCGDRMPLQVDFWTEDQIDCLRAWMQQNL